MTPIRALAAGFGRLRGVLPGVLFAAALLAGAAGPAHAGGGSALIMITSSTCPWCDAWEEEVGVSYDRTEEAKIYPLRRIDVFNTMPPEFDGVEGSSFTPTFIFVRDGREVGRIVGYPGDELFWWRVSEFVPDPTP